MSEEIIKRPIESREEVSLLVNTFYAKIRKEETLGPIFNTIVQDWGEHLEKLTDFWESSLLFVRKYYGNSMLAHISVDRELDNTVEMKHFGIWLNLWYETLDEYFTGEVAQRAKNNARQMSTNLFLKIFQYRPQY